MPEVSETTSYVRTFHGVLNETDPIASHTATVDLLAMFVLFLEPKVVVEAGTYRGHFAFAAANILRQLDQGGVVYTADPIDRITATLASPGADKLRPHISYHQGDFREMLATTVPAEIDLAYIDASSKENPHMRWEHYRLAYDRLRPGGLCLVDDTEGDWGDAKWIKETSDIHLTQARGLSIFQKKPTNG